MGGADFSELLRELKGRSGLSYGVLAKRLHVSTSTLHRYCNGDAVPTAFATVEKLARLCKASPEELVELHRRWILADAARGRKAEGPAGGGLGGPAPEPELDPTPLDPTPGDGEVGGGPQDGGAAPRRRRTILLAAAAGLGLILGSTALALNGVPGSGDSKAKADRVVASGDGKASVGPSADGARNPKSSPSASRKARDEDATGGSKRPGSGRGGAKSPSPNGQPQGDGAPSVPLATRTRPYVYESPCSQNFLVDRKPNQVPQPPAVEQDAPGWAADLGAVSSGEQLVEVTVQGMGEDTVVLQDMNVRVQSTGSPLDWNNYEMGVGCGGNVSTKSFGVDLDDGQPDLTPKAGQRDFPYKVSESDPEVFYVKANVEAHDVRWYLELKWSSGKRHGVLRVDDQGKPFRTSGREGRPTYGWPLGGSKWEAPLDG
ncbi:helix-turn-helix domain-containing protein [Streptomyces sp. NPDC050658]|uniref:transcriptional regulator n=1 Tax=Streptomyces sp. NPDC050658 TaxID=3365633 RepID=UPI00378AFFD5